MQGESWTIAPKFAVGAKVTIPKLESLGHCRAPWYLRGHTGEVCEILGTFRNPEQLAYMKPGLPVKVLYKVRFKQVEIWDSYTGQPGDTLEADVYENWLTPAAT